MDFSFPVERSSSSSTSWKLDKDRDAQCVGEGMICLSFCCVLFSRSYMFSSISTLFRVLMFHMFNHVVSVYILCLFLL